MFKLKRKIKKGDTLVEVALAIGLLSFVVLGVTSIMTSALQASETTLEDTMARNEMDVQAEAIRYIQSAYAAQRNFTESQQDYSAIWKRITAQAITPGKLASLNSVSDCNEFYNTSNAKSIFNSSKNNRAFVVNTHRLDAASARSAKSNANLAKSIILTTTDSSSNFQLPTVYPRVLYGTSVTNDDNETLQGLSGAASYNRKSIYRAEGIWVNVVCSDVTSGNCDDKPEYYDFYIRTCWDSPTKHSTSTIGTIVRLHNPDVKVKATEPINFTVTYRYFGNGPETFALRDEYTDLSYHTFAVRPTTAHYALEGRWANIPLANHDGWVFVGWTTSDSNLENLHNSPEQITPNYKNPNITLKAVYQSSPVTVTYDANGGSFAGVPTKSQSSGNCRTTAGSGGTCQVSLSIPTLPTRAGYVFNGWSTSPSGPIDTSIVNGKVVNTIGNTTYYAQWQTATYSEWAFMATWTGGCTDVDSYTYVKSGSTVYGPVMYGNKTATYAGTKVSLDHDYTSPGNIETTTIDDLGSNSAYFCTKCYGGGSLPVNDLRVVVTKPTINLYTPYTLGSAVSEWSVVKISGNSVSYRNAAGCTVGW